MIIPRQLSTLRPRAASQTAVLAGGCFWGVQGVFQHTSGVVNAVSGYAGGSKMTADYNMVSSGTTGHAEAVEIKYDPRKISYGKILQIFFSVVHDPTQLNRQGPDWAHNIARPSSPPMTSRKRLRTPISPAQRRQGLPEADRDQGRAAGRFFQAEAYHQDYLTLHPNQPYIAYNDLPKVENLKKIFAENYIEKPTLVSSIKVTN